MKFYITVFLSTFFIGLGLAQTVTITDRDTGKPLSFVTLVSSESSNILESDSQGVVDIYSFLDAKQIVISFFGYKTLIYSYQEIQSKGYEIRMESNQISLGEVIVSSSKYNQNSQDVPERIRTISKEEIDLQNPQTAADLLNLDGYVYIQKSQQGGGSPIIRGYSTNRLLYSIDGVRMNNAIFRGGNIQNVISLDAFTLEHTEILFGPGSVVYGSDAIGGVMSFQTLLPRLASNKNEKYTDGNAFVRFSSANSEKTIHADYNLGFRRWSLLSSFSYTDFSDLRMGRDDPYNYRKLTNVEFIDGVDSVVVNPDPYIQTPSGYDQFNMMHKLRFRANDQWDFLYGFHYSKTSEYGRYDRHLRTKDGLPRYAEWNYGPQGWLMNYISIKHNAQSKIADEVDIRLAQQTFEESRISRNYREIERQIQLEKVLAYSVNVDVHKKLSTTTNLSYGFEWVLNQVESQGSRFDIISEIAQNAQNRYPQSKWNSVGTYITGQKRFSPKLIGTAGMRYNLVKSFSDFSDNLLDLPFDEASLFNQAMTGSVGIVYKANPHAIISSNLATAFRAPNIDDIGKVFDSEPGRVVVPNVDLKPEYAYNADVSGAFIFKDRIKIDFSLYYSYLDNALVRSDFSLNGKDSIDYQGESSKVQAIQNIASAQTTGLQFGAEVEVYNNFFFSSKINIQQGIEEVDDNTQSPSRHVPPIFGNTKLSYKSKSYQLEVYSIFNAERSFMNLPINERAKTEIYARDDHGNPFSPAWFTLNVKTQIKLIDQLQFGLGIENILDLAYRPYSSGIAAPGRNVVISIHYGF